jgi:hypothetical protein
MVPASAGGCVCSLAVHTVSWSPRMHLELFDVLMNVCLSHVTLQKSFEEVQAAVRARKQAGAGSSSSSGDVGSAASTSTQRQQQQEEGHMFHIRSSWADGMRGGFVAAEPGDPAMPDEGAAAAGGAAPSPQQHSSSSPST